MEPYELVNKLVGKEIWQGNELLSLDEKGIPELEAAYQLEEFGEWINRLWKYIDNKWVEQKVVK